MDTGLIIQFAGTITGGLVVLDQILNRLREWRGGSPELRLINRQLEGQNQRMLLVIDSNSQILLRIANKLGV